MGWSEPDAVTQWNEMEASNEIDRDMFGLHECLHLWVPKEMRLADKTKFVLAEARVGMKTIKNPDAESIDMMRSHV